MEETLGIMNNIGNFILTGTKKKELIFLSFLSEKVTYFLKNN